MTNHIANPLSNQAVEIREAVTHENKRANHADQAVNPPRNEAAYMREAGHVPWQGCLPESTGGEARLCQDSREGGFHTSVALASTVLLGHL